jgi:hypothetical protein
MYQIFDSTGPTDFRFFRKEDADHEIAALESGGRGSFYVEEVEHEMDEAIEQFVHGFLAAGASECSLSDGSDNNDDMISEHFDENLLSEQPAGTDLRYDCEQFLQEYWPTLSKSYRVQTSRDQTWGDDGTQTMIDAGVAFWHARNRTGHEFVGATETDRLRLNKGAQNFGAVRLYVEGSRVHVEGA